MWAVWGLEVSRPPPIIPYIIIGPDVEIVERVKKSEAQQRRQETEHRFTWTYEQIWKCDKYHTARILNPGRVSATVVIRYQNAESADDDDVKNWKPNGYIQQGKPTFDNAKAPHYKKDDEHGEVEGRRLFPKCKWYLQKHDVIETELQGPFCHCIDILHS